MKRLKFTEEQIIAVLKEAEAKRLRALGDENAKLKRLLADAMLDNADLKDLLAKNWQRPLPVERRSLVSRRPWK